MEKSGSKSGSSIAEADGGGCEGPFQVDMTTRQDFKFTDPMTPEQHAIYEQLHEMFGTNIKPDVIKWVCNLFKWQLDQCVDCLIKFYQDQEKQAKQTGGGRHVIDNFRNASNDNLTDSTSEFVYSHTNLPSQPNNSIISDKHVDKASLSNITTADKPNDSSYVPQLKFQSTDQYAMDRNLGAIPKYSNAMGGSNNRPPPAANLLDFNYNPSVVASGANTKTFGSTGLHLRPLLDSIRCGYKVLVLMRGAPGSGKSHLARSIVDETVKGYYRDHVFSTDDYFYDSHGNYRFQPDRLGEIHENNQRCVSERARDGWSPIIVDNTNVKLWEMYPYVRTALEYGYLIELVEPKTPWSRNAGKLATKNRHDVTKEKIQRILDNYERTTVTELITLVKNRYRPVEQTQLVPQMRHHPSIIVPFTKESVSKPTVANRNPAESNFEQPTVSTTSVDYERLINIESDDQTESSEKLIPIGNNDTDQNWKSYDEANQEFWRNQQSTSTVNSSQDAMAPKPSRHFGDDRRNEESSREVDCEQTIASVDKLTRHEFGCENENQQFVMLRQIYPNKEPNGLWDLFEKCQGNIDWAVDILLKDDSCTDHEATTTATREKTNHQFECDCKKQRLEPIEDGWDLSGLSSDNNNNNNGNVNDGGSEEIKEETSPKRQRSKRVCDKAATVNQVVTDELMEVKRIIENQFVISDKYYSNHTKKIRDLRHGPMPPAPPASALAQQTNPFLISSEPPTSESNEATRATSENKENDDQLSDTEEDEVVEITLGEALAEQLSNMFKLNLLSNQRLKDMKTNIFIPKSLAFQLYLSWVESVYNQAEEQKQKTIQEDEDLARMLATKPNQQRGDSQDAQNLRDDLLTYLYSDKNSWVNANNEDLASNLTRRKLCELFPNIEEKTLIETLKVQDNRFDDTVEILQSNFDQVPNAGNLQQFEDTTSSSSDTEKPLFQAEKNLNPDEAKRIALRNFEVNRNMAVHHSQLKAECYQKAKEAIQKGNTAVAVYYSQIADYHKQKIDACNHSAANYIIAVHDFTQNNPDFIDLHYLHLTEAEQCLDIFLDRHVRKLKTIGKMNKNVFIITGRGLHSAGGVGIIKSKVKNRLRERNLKWMEINPGLLRVKIFSTSKYAKAAST